MKFKITFFLIIFLHCFFDCKASFVGNFYAQNYQLINTIGVITAVSVISGLIVKKQLKSGPDGKKMSFGQAITFAPQLYFSAKNENEITVKELVGRLCGAAALGFMLGRASNNLLTTKDVLLCIVGIILPRIVIG